MTTDENNHSSVRAASITQPEVRERILDAAEKKFREYGYLKVTVADVAHDLDMSPANVYRFFDSKASLRESLVGRLTHQVEDVCAKVAHGEGTAAERLSNMIVEYHRMTLDRYICAANVHEILDTAIRENWNYVVAHMERMQKIIWELILEGTHNAEFKVNDVDSASRLVNYAIIAFIDPSCVARFFADEKDFKQARAMSAFIIGALKSGSV
jgi:AcrR family transcriptional regulator